MKEESFRRWLLFTGAFLLAMVACSPKREAAPVEKVKLKMATRPLLINLPGYISQEEGFFNDAGLEVEFVAVGQGLISEVIPPLTSGEIDAATATLSFAHFNALVRGVDLKVVAGKGGSGSKSDSCSGSGFMAPKALVDEGRLKEVADLKGRKVAANLDTSDGYYANELLKTGGLTLNDIQAVTLPITSRVDALLGGSIDLGLVSEPQITQAKETGKVVVWKELREVANKISSAFILYGPNLLTKNRDAGDRLLAAYLKGIAQFDKGPTDRNLEIAVKHTEQERELLEEVCWAPQGPTTEIDWASLQGFQDYGIERGFLDGEIKEDQFWTDDYLKRAEKIIETEDDS